MPSYKITTFKSAFIKVPFANKTFNCAGCNSAIKAGSEFYSKPHYVKGQVIGQTRLHNLESCWEDYDEKATNVLIARRERKNVSY